MKDDEEKKEKENKQLLFRFQRFTIDHTLCGMKVGTDALLLGGFVANEIKSRFIGERRGDGRSNTSLNGWSSSILDIGTGSGILSLMLAQCCLDLPRGEGEEMFLQSVDIETTAIEQASFNFERFCTAMKTTSPLKLFIQLSHSPIQLFDPLTTPSSHTFRFPPYPVTCSSTSTSTSCSSTPSTSSSTPVPSHFQIIVAAPPYFISTSKDRFVSSMNPARKTARHISTLSMSDLCSSVSRLLDPLVGIFCLILSYPSPSLDFEVSAQSNGMKCLKLVNVRDNCSSASSTIRRMYIYRLYTPEERERKEEYEEKLVQDISIYQTERRSTKERRLHSDDYVQLLQDYCLRLP
jgi:tRNA1(Val) A37 N6-methylase TrmN6